MNKNITAVIIAIVIVGGSSAFSFPEKEKPSVKQLWKGYKTWYKPTGNTAITGDETGFLGNMHQGEEGYRVVYINKVGEAVNKGERPYRYPEGTVVVKEQFKNRKSYEAGHKPTLKIMVKLAKGASPKTNDWGFITGFNKRKIHVGRSEKAVFCGGCHAGANLKSFDYVFVNASSFPIK